MLVFLAYALVQANRLGSSTSTYDVYDSDNYPQASHTTLLLPQRARRPCCERAKSDDDAVSVLNILLPASALTLCGAKPAVASQHDD